MALEVPQVVKDPDLKEFTSNLNVRPEVVARLMLAGGVALEEIPEHTIEFSAERGQEQAADGVAQYGNFDHDTLTSTVFMGSHYENYLTSCRYWLEKTGYWPPNNDFRKAARLDAEQVVNTTLLHETKHAIDFSVMGADEYLREQIAYHHGEAARLGCWGATGLYAGVGVAFFGLYELSATATPGENVVPLAIMGTGIASMFGFSYLFKRHLRDANRKHRQYLAVPGEIRAREYADEQYAAITNPSQLPVRFKFKQPTIEQLAA